MTTKQCPKCKQNKTLDQFNKNKSKKDGVQSYCRECSKLENDNYYKSNKLKSNFNAKEYKEKRRQEIKRGLKCSKCGEDHPACLVFHHVDPTQKEYTIAYMINRSYSMDKIQKEKAKCIVLCANCHHKLHYG